MLGWRLLSAKIKWPISSFFASHKESTLRIIISLLFEWFGTARFNDLGVYHGHEDIGKSNCHFGSH